MNCHYKSWSSTKKEGKYERGTERAQRKRCILTLDLKPTQIIGKREVIPRQTIPESSSLRKETVSEDILITSRTDNRKIMQHNRLTSGPSMRTTIAQLANNPAKIFHIIDIEKLLGINNLDDFIGNTSF